VTPRQVDEQHAHIIQNADVINNHPSAVLDHYAAGVGALHEERYRDALLHLDSALDAGGARSETWFYSALALMRGIRPLRHPRVTLVEVDRRLERAGDLPAAVVLRALVADDYTQAWRRHTTLPADLNRLVSGLGDRERQEISRHVPAPESRVWRALQQRKRRG